MPYGCLEQITQRNSYQNLEPQKTQTAQKSARVTRLEENRNSSTPLINFQISTMNEEDQSQNNQNNTERKPSCNATGPHQALTGAMSMPSIQLQRVQNSQETFDVNNQVLESQVMSTLIALDHQSLSILNQNGVDVSDKENVTNGLRRYQNERPQRQSSGPSRGVKYLSRSGSREARLKSPQLF